MRAFRAVHLTMLHIAALKVRCTQIHMRTQTHRHTLHLRTCVHTTIDPSIHGSIDQSIHRSIDPSIHRSIHPSIHPSIHASLHPCILASVHAWIDTTYIHTFIHGADRHISYTNSQAASLPAKPTRMLTNICLCIRNMA